MSNAPRPPAICDAGPLIHLGEIGAARLLGQFHPPRVPPSVRAEAVSFHPPPDFAREIAAVSASDRGALTARLSPQLDPGESDCLAFCAQHRNAIFLTDQHTNQYSHIYTNYYSNSYANSYANKHPY